MFFFNYDSYAYMHTTDDSWVTHALKEISADLTNLRATLDTIQSKVCPSCKNCVISFMAGCFFELFITALCFSTKVDCGHFSSRVEVLVGPLLLLVYQELK